MHVFGFGRSGSLALGGDQLFLLGEKLIFDADIGATAVAVGLPSRHPAGRPVVLLRPAGRTADCAPITKARVGRPSTGVRDTLRAVLQLAAAAAERRLARNRTSPSGGQAATRGSEFKTPAAERPAQEADPPDRRARWMPRADRFFRPLFFFFLGPGRKMRRSSRRALLRAQPALKRPNSKSSDRCPGSGLAGSWVLGSWSWSCDQTGRAKHARAGPPGRSPLAQAGGRPSKPGDKKNAVMQDATEGTPSAEELHGGLYFYVTLWAGADPAR